MIEFEKCLLPHMYFQLVICPFERIDKPVETDDLILAELPNFDNSLLKE